MARIDVLQQYIPIYESDADIILLFGTGGSGKSHATALKVANWLLSEQSATVLMVRQQYNTIRNSIWNEVKNAAYLGKFNKYLKFSRSNLQVETKINNSIAIPFGCHDIEQLNSISNITHAWIEELTQINEHSYNSVLSRVRSKKSKTNQVICTFNPPSSNSHWVVDRYLKGNDQLPNFNEPKIIDENGLKILLLRTSLNDNPYITEQSRLFYANLKERDKDLYYRLVLGAIGVGEVGSIFKKAGLVETDDVGDVRGCVYVDSSYSTTGNADRTVILKASTDRVRVYIEDAIILKEFDTTKTLNAVRELSSPYHRFVCFDGHFGQKAIWSDAIKQYLKQTGIGITPYFAAHRVDDYLDIMQLLWSQGRIVFDTKFSNSEIGKDFLSEVYSFRGKAKTAKGDHDDCPDAMISSVLFLEQLGLFKPTKILY